MVCYLSSKCNSFVYHERDYCNKCISFCQAFLVNLVEVELLDSKVHQDRGVMQDFLDLKAGLVQVVRLGLQDHREIEVLLDQQDHPASLALMDNVDQ